MKTQFTLSPLCSLPLLCAMLSVHSHAQDSFTRINTGPGAVPNGSSAAAWGDFNNDGWLDLFITSFGGTQYNYCYTNNGNGTFTQVLPTFFPASNINSYGCAWADYDNDGYLDLVKGIGNPFGGPTQLYRNNHNGTFANVTTASIGNVGPGAQNVVWGDYDNDGFVDLFMAVGFNAPDNILLHNRGDGTFGRVTGNPMVSATGISGGASWGDYDNDGRLDLIVTRTSAGCLLYHNESGGTFRQITNQVISVDTNAAGVSWGDYDNDGFLDLFIAHQQSPNRLYRNNGDGNFTLLTNGVIYQMTGPSSGGAWADYDNDGWLDLFVANYRGNSFLFHNDGKGGFTSVAGAVTEYGTGQGAAWGDYDNDGFPDLLVPNIFTYNNFLYHNNGNSNAWLTLKLEGRISNRTAIGAKVRIKATIQGRELWQLREISGGGSLGSQNDLRAGFGLGDATNAGVVRIEWPSGIVQELHNVPAKQFLTVVEPTASVVPAMQQVDAGGVAVFTISTTFAPPFICQWRFNDVDLTGETNLTLVISNVRTADAGKYSVTLINPETGFLFTARPAVLGGPVVIAQQPKSLATFPGTNVSLRIAASGFGPLTYQWQFNGDKLLGATNDTLSLTNVQWPNEGSYRAVVSNHFGAVLSSDALLMILIRPVITNHPVSQTVLQGGTATFTVLAGPDRASAPLSYRWLRNSAAFLTSAVPELVLSNVQSNATIRVSVINAAVPGGVASTNATLTVLADFDGDGMADIWEEQYFGASSTNDSSNAALDADGDGMSNLAEYLAGTDPADAQSLLRIEAFEWSANSVLLRFTAMSNTSYTIQSRPFVGSSNWNRVVDVPTAPTNRTFTLTDPADAKSQPQRFYRVTTPRMP